MSMKQVSIPQAVGTVATVKDMPLDQAREFIVSIPQAVGTVATEIIPKPAPRIELRFNTASGRYCCNRNNT